MLKKMMFLLWIAGGLAALGAAGAQAGSFSVESLSDALDTEPGDGLCDSDAGTPGEQCTLRAAIQEANASERPCRITLAAGVHLLSIGGDGEDAAASGDLDVIDGADVTIRGRGEDSVIDAAGLDRVFDVLAGGSLALDRVSLTGGDTPVLEAGGGIRNAGTLVVSSSTISGNSADALADGHGGGIHNTGDLMVSKSELTGNSATIRGGALFHSGEGVAMVTGSVFTTNSAAGPLATDGGGAIYNDGGTLEVSKSEFVDNSATTSGGAIHNNAGTLEVSKSHFQDNRAERAGGAIESNAGTTLLDKVDMIENETGPNPGNGGGFHQTGAGDVSVIKGRYERNTAAEEGGALWNGTNLMTVVGSRIHGNTASGEAADQGGGGIFNAGGTLTVEKARIEQNEADGSSGSGGGILNDGGTLVVIKTRIDGNRSVRAGGGVEAVLGNTTLDKVSMSDNETGNGPGNGGGLHVTGTGTATVQDSKLRGNRAAGEGGGLWNGSGTMTVRRSQVRDNVASGSGADEGGGGLFNAGGTLNVLDGTKVSRNQADGLLGSGGGILNDGGQLDVSDSTLDKNSSSRAGGGIEAVGDVEETGATSLLRVKLSGNSTGANPGNGGGLHVTDDTLVEISNSSVSKNEAGNEGGGLWNSETGTLTVTTSSIKANQAPTGPDVFNDGGAFSIDGVEQPDDSP